MIEYISDETQNKNIDLFRESISKGNVDKSLRITCANMNLSLESMKNSLINGEKIVDTDAYKTYLPIFMEITEKIFANKYESMRIFGFSESEIDKMNSSSADKKEIGKMFISRFNLNLSNKENFTTEVLHKITDKMTPDVVKQNTEYLTFSSLELNKLVKGIELYNTIDAKNQLKQDMQDKEYTSLSLYKDAVEIYLKVLREIYCKLNKSKKRVNNNKIYSYFEDNYPLLWDSKYNLLRNDVSHLNFDVRGNYSLEKIDTERNSILLKAMTGIIARDIFLLKNFERQVDLIIDATNNPNRQPQNEKQE